MDGFIETKNKRKSKKPKRMIVIPVVITVLAILFLGVLGFIIGAGDGDLPENADYLEYYLRNDGTLAVGIGNATHLEKIEIPKKYAGKKITEILDFTSENLKEVIIPGSITSINHGSFSGCKSLLVVRISEGVTTIGERAFENCESLTIVTLPNTLTTISEMAFANCKSLLKIILPSGVSVVEGNAFKNCIALENVIITSNATNIKDYAFSNCMLLSSIELPNGVTNIGKNAFYNCTFIDTVYFDGVLDDWRKMEKYAWWSVVKSQCHPSVICTDVLIDSYGNVID